MYQLASSQNNETFIKSQIIIIIYNYYKSIIINLQHHWHMGQQNTVESTVNFLFLTTC